MMAGLYYVERTLNEVPNQLNVIVTGLGIIMTLLSFFAFQKLLKTYYTQLQTLE